MEFTDNQHNNGLGLWDLIRMYSETEIKVSVKEGYKIAKIEFFQHKIQAI